jgi:hypothetical protein
VGALGGRSGVFSVLELFPLKKGVHSLLARLCQHGEWTWTMDSKVAQRFTRMPVSRPECHFHF